MLILKNTEEEESYKSHRETHLKEQSSLHYELRKYRDQIAESVREIIRDYLEKFNARNEVEVEKWRAVNFAQGG